MNIISWKWFAVGLLGGLLVIWLLNSVPERAPRESICTMDGDQARAFKRQCEAEGGEIRIHEYTCEKWDE